jgi:hypothetical protein
LEEDPDVLAQTEGMIACLQEAGLPAVVGRIGVTLDTDEPFELCNEIGCQSQASEEPGEDDGSALLDELRRPYESAGASAERLLFKDADYTAVYLACKEKTGYSVAAKAREWAEERLAGLAAEVEAGVEWATCVRDNGYPDVADPIAPTLATIDYEAPEVVLPESMTDAELRALLEVCPAFDTAAWEAADRVIDQQLEAGVPYDQVDWSDWDPPAMPVVNFGDPANPFDITAPDAEERMARIRELLEIAQAEHWDYQERRVEYLQKFEYS